jgi:Fur family ferric uptake transcriptional regulator
MPAENSLENFAKWRVELHSHGLKATHSRLAVLNLLSQYKRLLSHAEITASLGEGFFDKATIFRKLIDLSDAGLLRRFDFGDHTWRFEIAGHCSGDHVHLICSQCGSVICLAGVLVDELRGEFSLNQEQTATIDEVVVKGKCLECLKGVQNATGLQL